VQLLSQWRNDGTVRHYLDISPRAADFGLPNRRVELAAGDDSGGKPALAAHRVRKLVVTPFREIIIVDVRVLAEQPFDQIAVVVEHKDDWLQPEAMELADFLGRQWCDPSPVTRIVRRSGDAKAARKAAGVAQPIEPQRV